MDTSTLVTLSGSFFKSVGEILADLKRQDIARIDVDLLHLKRTVLSEQLEDFKT